MAQKVLFDTDPGCDDAVMMMMALGHPAIEVVGVSTVCGNTTVENTTHNALALLELFGAEDVPVARGRDRPIERELSTAEHIHGERGIRGHLPEPEGEPIATDGVDFIVEQAREHGDDLVIAAAGPLTNLALALIQEPDLPEMVDDIYIMGGAAFTAGNRTPTAEANFYNDPVAASRVVQQANAKIVGLDVTHHAAVPRDKIREYKEGGELSRTIAEWIDYYSDEKTDRLEGDGTAIHDAVIIADIIDRDVLEFQEYYCQVDISSGLSAGNFICDKYSVLERDPTAAVAVEIDSDRFRELLYTSIDTVTR